MSNKPVVLIGGGGHAAVCLDILQLCGREVVAVIAPESSRSESFNSLNCFATDEEIKHFMPAETDVVIGVGFMPFSTLRHDLYRKFKQWGYSIASVISPHAVISTSATLGEGVQIFHQAVVQTNAVLGEHCIINTAAVIEHDCIVGAHSHLAPRALLCGQVTSGHDVFIGASAALRQGITVGDHAIIGMGTTVRHDVAANQTITS